MTRKDSEGANDCSSPSSATGRVKAHRTEDVNNIGTAVCATQVGGAGSLPVGSDHGVGVVLRSPSEQSQAPEACSHGEALETQLRHEIFVLGQSSLFGVFS